MQQITLQAVPNQTLSIQLDNNSYDIVIRAVNIGNAQVMVFDISINNVVIVLGQRAVAGYPIIPYAYLYDGNFIVITSDDDLLDYTKFQISQYLIYASQAELEEIYASS